MALPSYVRMAIVKIWLEITSVGEDMEKKEPVCTVGGNINGVQFSSFTQLCLTLCNPTNCSMPGLPVHRQLLEFTQTQVHQVSDAIQPSHPLSSPSPPAPNTSQHQSLFQWVNSSREVAKYWSFSFSLSPSNEHPGLISFRMDWLDLLAPKGLSRVFSNTTVQNHQFFGAQLSS